MEGKKDPFESIKLLAKQTSKEPSVGVPNYSSLNSNNSSLIFGSNGLVNFQSQEISNKNQNIKKKDSDLFKDLLNFSKDQGISAQACDEKNSEYLIPQKPKSGKSESLNQSNNHLQFNKNKDVSYKISDVSTNTNSIAQWDFDLLKPTKSSSIKNSSQSKSSSVFLDFDPISTVEIKSKALEHDDNSLSLNSDSKIDSYFPVSSSNKPIDSFANWDDFPNQSSHNTPAIKGKQYSNVDEMDAKIASIMQHGFSIDQAVDSIQISNGDSDLALSLLKEQSSMASASSKSLFEHSSFYEKKKNSDNEIGLMRNIEPKSSFTNSRNSDFFDSLSKKSMLVTEKFFASATEVGSNVFRQANNLFDKGKTSILNNVRESGGYSANFKNMSSPPISSNANLNNNSKSKKFEKFRDSESESDNFSERHSNFPCDHSFDSDFEESGFNFKKKTIEFNHKPENARLNATTNFQDNPTLNSIKTLPNNPLIPPLKLKAISVNDESNIPFSAKLSVPIIPPALIDSVINIRESSNGKFKLGQYEDAFKGYSEAINLLDGYNNYPYLIILLNNRSLCLSKMGNFGESIIDLNESINLCSLFKDSHLIEIKGEKNTIDVPSQYQKSLLRRAETYEAIEKYKLALEDFNLLLGILTVPSLIQRVKTGISRCSQELGISNDSKKPAIGYSSKNWSYPSKISPGPNYFKAPLSENTKRKDFPKNISNSPKLLTDVNEPSEQELFELRESAKSRILLWKKNKDSIRALLSGIHSIFPSIDEIKLSELIENNRVKVAYIKTISKLHPDKLSPDTSTFDKYLAEEAFTVLNESWVTFKTQNNIK
ncbi:UBA domain-containing protein 7 [Smittium mucronatum]|uniref:UBA domain-containing protein 7 n=1 Tax=Smittium mucronatum TaxID=133383 RepID=A0A1R0GRJ9_9FUNG|nr:UBA domain-containing protein 7 [Smittium mucronatum]